METPRYLCSQLVTLIWKDGADTVNLEEIRARGAVLESETDVPVDTLVEIRCESVFFKGKVTRAKPHDWGFRIEVEFSPLTPWSIERFRPEHLLDLSAMEDGATGSP